MPVVAQHFEADADLTQLRDHPRNPRRGDDGSVATSVDRNGWYGAIIAQRSTRHILAGHTRRRVLTAGGNARGPVFWLDCDDATATRILLADNRTAELAAWDNSELLELLGDITPDDLGAAGFTLTDIQSLQRQVEAAGAAQADYAAEWQEAGMPAYASEDLSAVYQTTLSFRSVADADAFFALIALPKSKRLWWPEPDGHPSNRLDLRVAAEVIA